MTFGNLVASVALLGLATSPVPAMAQDAAKDAAQKFEPAGQWSLDYGNDYCRLARNFSDGKDTLSLAVERIQPGPMARLILVSDAIKPFRSAQEIGWHFIPTDPERKARYTHAPTADGRQYYNLGQFAFAGFSGSMPLTGVEVQYAVSASDIPAPPADAPGKPSGVRPPAMKPFDRAAEQAAAKTMNGLVLDNGLSAPIEVETGDLGDAVAALQACADDLAKSWGLDPAKLQSERSPAIPDGGGANWLPQGTIAFTDFAKLSGGSNQVRLMVDATGKPTSCAIHWPTLDATTNDKICKTLLASAKFTPAKDADGQPMAGFWVASPMMLGPPMKGFGRP